VASDLNQQRARIIQIVFVLATGLLIGQLLNLQVINTEFRRQAESAGYSIQLDYPSRGLLFDRNGQLLVTNNNLYDLEVTYTQFEAQAQHFDTARFCRLLGITEDYFIAALDKNWRDERYDKSLPFTFLSKIPPERFAAFQENLYQFPGFSVQERNARGYPHHNAGHALGYVVEVSPSMLKDSNQLQRLYLPGDYVGITGLERQYEYYLRGKKGLRKVEKDIMGRTIGQYRGGREDTPPEAGLDLFTTLDLDLQAYGESLMKNKIGGIVAIEPATGEVLAMISTPNYDPNLLTFGPDRGRNYLALQQDSLLPFFNRTIQAEYPPGSLFKPIVALIGLQEGVLHPNRTISCGGAYYFDGLRLTGCHNHPTCTSVAMGIQHSCNAYFVQSFREIIDQYKDETTPRRGLDRFNEYLYAFGMGNPLGLDFPGEKGGNVPTSEFYDQVFANETGWKSIWIRSLGIGQGEYLTTNLQLANMAAAIANRGYYYTPHLVRAMRSESGQTRPNPLALDRREIGIDAEHFTYVIDGMEMVVRAGTATAAFIPDIPICGKTGTAENPHGADHSIFFAFAPKENPRIAIAVYVENGGWGGSYAAPIASLMIEKYIRGEIMPQRQWWETRMREANLIDQKP
jgi:penicillin-binding protein 2